MPKSPTAAAAAAAARKWAAEDDWERHKATITTLYETMTLAELKDYMEVNHGLSATNKMYKTRFKRWGLWKYTRAADIPHILKAKTERVAEQQPTEVYLNGKRVDLDKVERYLRRRGSIRRQVEAGNLYVQSPPASSPNSLAVVTRKRTPDRRSATPASPSSSLSLISPVSPISPIYPTSPVYLTSPIGPTSPTYLTPPPTIRVPEDTYRAIRDYYDGSFAGGRWVSVSASDQRVFLSTRTGLQDGSMRIKEFHQRFRLAFRLLQTPAQTGPEGMKMTRVCFAELPDVLAGEDPTMLYCILDLLRRLRASGMDFLAQQLLQYLDGLSATRPDGHRHAMAGIWRNLLLGLDELGPEQTRHCAEIAASRFSAHLGELHMKTLEAGMWRMFLSDATTGDREAYLRRLHGALEELPTFDYRNLFVAIDFASFLRKGEKLDEAAQIITQVLEQPEKNAVLRSFPPMAYNFVSVLGKIRATQGRMGEAEPLYRDAIEIAKAARTHDDTDLLDGLVYLEKCLRAQEKHAEADAVLAEREAVVRESLERVGEKEHAV
ncbi:hypothetical protein GE09DRAFT_17784 [Coniochaeta sp. 2T2.1]|nr:hypothetical protein GE09DRAFT_17784 [Coniochaeta sp. 2T2.1]